MKDNTNNKEYWNEYVSYWENKVKEANTDNKAFDKTSDDMNLERYVSKLEIEENDKVLDFGCGSARLFPIFKDNYYSSEYIGLDISRICLEHAQEKMIDLEIGKNLFEFDGITIPFESNSFDKIVCFGVFDACNQEIIIQELLRVVKVGGGILLTGKNQLYCQDDEAAYVAEVNARKKGHPNYFTDVKYLEKQLEEKEVDIIDRYYFLKRGDFVKDKYIKNMPDIFYEWALFLRKTKTYKEGNMNKFSDTYSQTYYLRK